MTTEELTVQAHVLALLREADRRYEQQFVALERAIIAATTASDKAMSIAQNSLEKRLDAVNEFRAMVIDQIHPLMPRSEADMRITTLDTRLTRLEAHGVGKATITGPLWGLAGAVAVGLIVAIFMLFLRR